MPHSSVDTDLNPDQRRRQVAAILARGILRLHTAGHRDTAQHSLPDLTETVPEKELEVSVPSRPHVARG